MTGLTWGAGTTLGLVMRGAFADSSATWRWAFYINLVILAAFAPIYFIWLPTIPVMPEKTFRAKILAIDWTRIALNAGIYTTVRTFGFHLVHQDLALKANRFGTQWVMALCTLGTPAEKLRYGLSLAYS